MIEAWECYEIRRKDGRLNIIGPSEASWRDDQWDWYRANPKWRAIEIADMRLLRDESWSTIVSFVYFRKEVDD